MKLATKINLALVLSIGTILGIQGKARLDRQLALFQEDIRRDHRGMGRALEAVVVEVWEDEGAERALELVAAVNLREASTRIGWVGIDDPATPEEARAGEVASRVEGELLSTWIPVEVADERKGALQLSESLEAQQRYARQAAVRVVAYGAVVLLLATGLVAGASTLFVVRPVQQLREHARRLGAGDLSSRLSIPQRDELGELADEMNAMTDQLAAALERIAQETGAKVAAVEQLRHADRLRSVGQLASGIAHELGTPLNVVGARAKMISSGEVQGDVARDNARIIREQADRMTAIIRQVLDFARPRPPARIPVDLLGLAQQTTSLLEPTARRHGVTVEVEGEARRVEVDPAQIQQVILNLALNGVQAMSDQGRLRIRVDHALATPPGEEEERPYARVLVEDEGSGILPEHLDRVFEPFFTTKDVGTGTGLGLSVSYGIVRDHGGFISVSSQPGRGSRFTVHLPEEAG